MVIITVLWNLFQLYIHVMRLPGPRIKYISSSCELWSKKDALLWIYFLAYKLRNEIYNGYLLNRNSTPCKSSYSSQHINDLELVCSLQCHPKTTGSTILRGYDTIKASFMTPTSLFHHVPCNTGKLFFNWKAWLFKQLNTERFLKVYDWILPVLHSLVSISHYICSLHYSRLCCLWAFTPTIHLPLSPPSSSGSTFWKPRMCVLL